MTEFKHSTTDKDETTRVAFWGTLIQAAILFVFFTGVLLLTILALGSGQGSDSTGTFVAYEVAVVMAVIVIMNISSLIFTIRGNQGLGYLLTYSSIILFVLNTVTLVQGQALFMSFLLLILSTLGIGWLCPPKLRRSYIIVAVIAFALTWVIEWINPPWRAEYSGTQLGPIAAIIFVIIFGAMLASQAWKGNIRVKIITAFTIVSLVSLGILGTVTFINYRNQVREDIRQRLLNMVSLIALQQDAELHSTIQNPGDEETDAYEQIRAVNSANIVTEPDLAYIYTMRLNEQGEIYFVVDTGQPGDEDLAAVAEKVENPGQKMLETFPTLDHPIVEEDFNTDRWGTFLSAYAPFYAEDGSREGIVGVDIAADKIIAQEKAVLNLILGTAAVAMVIVTLLGLFLGNIFTKPIINLSLVAQKITEGDLGVQAKVETTDEVGDLAKGFNTMTAQLRELIGSLEQRVAARTQDLATVAEVGTATATILETDKLLQEVVDLTKERFNLYHSHIYLLDERGENLVLASGAGEPGRIMVAEKRSIPLNREQSLVARAARERKGVIVNDVTQAPDFLPNPLLPDTRSELAVPMIVGGKVIGVFDIQSDAVGRFTESDVNTQITLAAQVATSIQNVRSFEQSKAQADLESLVNTIGQKIQRATTLEDTLQTAIRELGLVLGASRVSANIQANRQADGR
jgi:putative methionine-R-sulfoxide reductase with GAF domain